MFLPIYKQAQAIQKMSSTSEFNIIKESTRLCTDTENFLSPQQEPSNPTEFEASFGKPLYLKQRLLLDTFYEERHEVKALGAKWDGRHWYVPIGMPINPFWKYIGAIKHDRHFRLSTPFALDYDLSKIPVEPVESVAYVACNNPMYLDPHILHHIITKLGNDEEIVKFCRALKDTQHFESIKSWASTYRKDLLIKIFSVKLLALEDTFIDTYGFELIKYGAKLDPYRKLWFILKGTPLEPFTRPHRKYNREEFYLHPGDIYDYHERQKQELAKIGIQI